MNWKYIDSILRKKLKPRRNTSPSTKRSKLQLEGLNSLLSDPILTNLNDLCVTSQDVVKEKRLSCTCFVCHGKFFGTSNEQSHECEYDVTLTNSSFSNENFACNDELNDSTTKSELPALELSRSYSEDSGISSIGNDSICENLPRAGSCQVLTDSTNESKKRSKSSSEYKSEFMPEQKRARIKIPC